MKKAALGLRAHSGWAALVAVSGTRESIEVLDRRRVELSSSKRSGPKQPYHVAERAPFEKARRIVTRYADDASRMATEEFRALLADLKALGHSVVGCGLLAASGRPLPDLEGILASHALIHQADGELYRDAVAAAAKKHRLPLVRARERCRGERRLEAAPAAGGAPAPRRAAREDGRSTVDAGSEARGDRRVAGVGELTQPKLGDGFGVGSGGGLSGEGRIDL